MPKYTDHVTPQEFYEMIQVGYSFIKEFLKPEEIEYLNLVAPKFLYHSSQATVEATYTEEREFILSMGQVLNPTLQQKLLQVFTHAELK